MSKLSTVNVKLQFLNGLDFTKAQTDEFHKTFGHPVSDKPVELTQEQVITRAKFIIEELVELTATVSKDETEHFLINNQLIIALAEAEKKEVEKGFGEGNRLVAQADALTDISYFTSGTFTMMGVQPQPLFDIVQEANMAKLGPDGKPIYRESDGKIMKPEGWEPPEPKLEAEIERQLNK